MSAPQLTVLGVDCYERIYRLRIPFRFGIKTATAGKQMVLALRLRLTDGREATGYAAEALSAKWFDKNPALSDDQNHHQLRRAVALARDAYTAAGPSTAYGLFATSYAAHNAACAAEALNPLIASFGTAMLDRAVLDALCRATGSSFAGAMHGNLAGITMGEPAPDLAGFDIDGFLASLLPAPGIAIRHTVGLVDPLTAADHPTRVDDGLPETLEEVIAARHGRFYKVKIGGDAAADLDRLRRIASLLDAGAGDYRVTLDGNEQFTDQTAITDFYAQLQTDPALQNFAPRILCLEQPIRRDRALAQPVTDLAARVPVIIDESDGALDTFRQARALGYSGVSSKVCKGLYKSILNAARAQAWNRETPGRYFLSAEDLTCEPGISLQQDLALVSWLGLPHVEKNAHHFIDGFGDRPATEAEAFLAAHPDLYHRDGARIRLRITQGAVSTISLSNAAGFGTAGSPDLAALAASPQPDWPAGD